MIDEKGEHLPLEITDEIRAAVARERHVPDRAEIRELLVRYFVGPIEDEHVTRLADMFDRTREARRQADQSAFESVIRYRGFAWKEEVSEDRRYLDPIDHLLMMGHMMWEVERLSDARKAPQPKLYCPTIVVGTWEQVEPAHPGEPCLWHMEPDSSFRSNSPKIPPSTSYWCVERKYGWRDHEFSIVLRTAPDEGVWTLASCDVIGDELVATHVGLREVPFRLVRRDVASSKSAASAAITNPDDEMDSHGARTTRESAPDLLDGLDKLAHDLREAAEHLPDGGAKAAALARYFETLHTTTDERGMTVVLTSGDRPVTDLEARKQQALEHLEVAATWRRIGRSGPGR